MLGVCVSVSVTNSPRRSSKATQRVMVEAAVGWWGTGVLGWRGVGGGGGMLVTPVSQSVKPVSHFNYACISVFICDEQHS